jgi:hypothetical protein
MRGARPYPSHGLPRRVRPRLRSSLAAPATGRRGALKRPGSGLPRTLAPPATDIPSQVFTVLNMLLLSR